MIGNPAIRNYALPATIVMLLILLSACTTTRGPTTSESPYLVPVAAGVEFISILTVGDKVPNSDKVNESYRMAGIPDGLGAYDNDDGTIAVLMNHELSDMVGAVRRHGNKGAFISMWQIRKTDLTVLNGSDLINNLNVTDPEKTALNRLCSADLAAPTAFFNSRTGLGFNDGRIFMGGEEAGKTGRAFAHIATGPHKGTTYELSALGKASWENLVASPHEQDKTIVAGLDDAGYNKVFFFIGEKQKEGGPIERAGLAHGTKFAMKIDGYSGDHPATGFKSGRFSLIDDTHGTVLARPEDGAWDTTDPNRFYFVTTHSFPGNSRLWQITFDDITNPIAGGVIKVLLDGVVRGPKMMDNITIDRAGNLIIQEDPGNQAYLAKIWSYTPATDTLTELAQHDPARFTPGVSDFTPDEESSGVIDVTTMFRDVRGYDTEKFRYFLLDVQARTPVDGAELVERGQLLMMKVAKHDQGGH